MNQNRVPLGGKGDVVIAAASDASDTVKPLPVVDNCHLAGHFPFFHDFIKNLCVADSVGGLGSFVRGYHNGNRTLGSLSGGYRFPCVNACNLLVRQNRTGSRYRRHKAERCGTESCGKHSGDEFFHDFFLMHDNFPFTFLSVFLVS